MKKLICTLSFVALAFSACGGDEAELVTYEGVLEAQAANDAAGGTHFLVMDSGEKLAVRSLRVNLGSEQYEGNRLSVKGSLSEDEVFEIDGLSVLEVLDETDDDDGEFVTYRNSDLGFEIDHLESWDLDEGSRSVSFGKDGFSVSVTQTPFDYNEVMRSGDYVNIPPLLVYFEWKEPGVVYNNSDIEYIGPEKLAAIREDRASSVLDGANYVLYRHGFIYTLDYKVDSEASEADKETMSLVFKDMLRSFRFIGMVEQDFDEDVDGYLDEIEDVQDEAELPALDLELTGFESLPFHFKGSYPKSWYYSGSRGKDSGVRHFYSFADEVLEDDLSNEVIRLEIRSDDFVTSGSNITFGDRVVSESVVNGQLSISTEVEGQHYKLVGPQEYRSLLLNMAASIEEVTREE